MKIFKDIPTVDNYSSSISKKGKKILTSRRKLYLPEIYVLQESYEIYLNESNLDIWFYFRDYGLYDIGSIGFELIIESGDNIYKYQEGIFSIMYNLGNMFKLHIKKIENIPVDNCYIIINWISRSRGRDVETTRKIDKPFINPSYKDKQRIKKINEMINLSDHSPSVYSSKKGSFSNEIKSQAWRVYEESYEIFSDINDLINNAKYLCQNFDLSFNDKALDSNSKNSLIHVPINCYFDKGFYSSIYHIQNNPIIEKRISSEEENIQIVVGVDKRNLDLLLYLFNGTVNEHGFACREKNELYCYLMANHSILKLKTRISEIYSNYFYLDVIIQSDIYQEAKSVVQQYYDKIKKLRNETYKTLIQQKLIPSKWSSELKLYNLIKIFFPDTIYQFRADWLMGQSLDIYIPSANCAIEYQGQQHYEVVDYFGDEENYIYRTERDQSKKQKCIDQGVTLLEWPYNFEITIHTVRGFLRESVPEEEIRYSIIESKIKSYPINSLSDFFKVEEKVKKTKEKKEIIRSSPNEIRMFNSKGEYMKSYPSVAVAAKNENLSVGGIEKAIRGKRKTAGGFQWIRTLKDSPINDIDPVKEPKKCHTAKAVYQLNDDGEILNEFESISKASKLTGISNHSIYSALNGTQKTAGGFYWLYKNIEEYEV